MQVVYARCAGLDVHQETVSACVLVCEPDGKKRRQVRVFPSFTDDLLALADWLRKQGLRPWGERPGPAGAASARSRTRRRGVREHAAASCCATRMSRRPIRRLRWPWWTG
jgi:hypothetical protein